MGEAASSVRANRQELGCPFSPPLSIGPSSPLKSSMMPSSCNMGSYQHQTFKQAAMVVMPILPYNMPLVVARKVALSFSDTMNNEI
jgi:hypothetical protein